MEEKIEGVLRELAEAGLFIDWHNQEIDYAKAAVEIAIALDELFKDGALELQQINEKLSEIQSNLEKALEIRIQLELENERLRAELAAKD